MARLIIDNIPIEDAEFIENFIFNKKKDVIWRDIVVTIEEDILEWHDRE